MCTQPTRQEHIFSHWDSTEEKVQQTIFDEFKSKYQGCYTQRDLMNFLEQKLLGIPGRDKQDIFRSSRSRDKHCRQ